MKVYILWREFNNALIPGGMLHDEIVGVFKSKQVALNFVKKHNGILAEEFDDYPEYIPKEYYIIEEEPVLES